MLRITVLCLLVVSMSHLIAQEISFANPSFEGTPQHSTLPDGYTNCGFPSESPPDIQPNPTFQVTKEAYDGKTYMGMVIRDNDTWESFGTTLDAPLEDGKCYAFRIALAQSPSYYSVSRARMQIANYTDPVRLQVWGGNNECERGELLAESAVITHEDWRFYEFRIQPKQAAYQYLVFNVTYPRNII